MKTKHNSFKFLLFIFIEFFLTGFIQLFIPNANVVMKISNEGSIENAWICEKKEIQEILFLKSSSDIWEGFITNAHYNLYEHLEIDLNTRTAKSIENNYPVRLINAEKISYKYPNIWVMVIYSNLLKQILLFGVCNIALIIIRFIRTKYKINLADVFENFIYNTTSLTIIGKKTIIVTIILAIVSIVIKPGCDYSSISQAIAINLSGADVYQIQNIYEIYVNNIEFVTWPYNPVMLIFYSSAGIFAFGYPPFYLQTVFDILPAVLLKVVNITLMIATVLGVLGFLLENRMIQAKEVRKIYLWSIFNPLVFYIAVIYIQLDVFPIYCVCMGLLLFIKKDFKTCTGIIAAILLSIGVSCKMQNILMIPTITLFLFMIVLKNRKKISYIFIFVALVLINFINIYITNDIIGTFIGVLKQAERIWFSTYALAPGLYIYLTIFIIVLIFLLNAFLYNSKIASKYLLCNSMFMLGVIVLFFSATIISTPSSLIITFPAFILCMALGDNWVKRMIVALFSILCVVDVMFSSAGDVTNALNYFGQEGIFTTLENQLVGTSEGIKWISILNTIAKAGMTAYAIFFNKCGTKLLSGKEDLL